MVISNLIKQKSYERIEHVLRRHPLTFIPEIALFLVLDLVPVALYFLLNSLFPALFLGPISFPILVLFASAYYLSTFIFFYAQFITYYLDVWIITNDRVIDVEQLGLFSRTISEVDLFRIQDVTSDIKGVFATFFDYGNVAIKTASVNVHIVAKNVPRANKIREDLIRLAHQDRKYHFTQPGNKKS